MTTSPALSPTPSPAPSSEGTQPTSDVAPSHDEAAAVTPEFFSRLRTEFDANSANRVAQNAVSLNSLTDVALDRTIVTGIDHTYSHLLDDWEVTNQKKSGRCWMFAALNLLRVPAMKKMGLKNFEFSQNYTLFWDKFERSNYFLESIIGTADRPVDDRTVSFLLGRELP